VSFQDRLHEDDYPPQRRGFAWKISAIIALVVAVTYLMKETRSWQRDWKPRSKTEHERLLEIAPIDLNSASLEQLSLLPHVKAEQASAIIGMRPIESIDQLDDVYGIGEKTLGLIRPHVYIDKQDSQ